MFDEAGKFLQRSNNKRLDIEISYIQNADRLRICGMVLTKRSITENLSKKMAQESLFTRILTIRYEALLYLRLPMKS